MAHEQESQQRKAARIKMKDALRLFEGRHPEQGVDAMKEVLEIDPQFIEPRQWLADYYDSRGQERLAVSQYEEMLRLEPDNPELWEGLRRVNPVIAEKLERLRKAPPDPILAQGVNAGDLDDFEEEDDDDLVAETAQVTGGTPFQGAVAADDDVFVEDEEDEEAYEPLAWEHEQDGQFRVQVEQNRGFKDVMDGCDLFWNDPQGWSHLVGECRAPEDAHWPMLEELFPAAAADLLAKIPSLLVEPGHTKTPVPLPLKNPTLVVGESLKYALGSMEILFVLGMGIHGLLHRNAQMIWASQVVTERVLDCDLRRRVLRNASEFTMGWEQGMPRDEVARIRKLCHAWEMRAVLSADRAGLLAASNLNSSLRAIAALVANEGDAMTASPEKLFEQFKDIPPNELAAIPITHDPWTDPRYAAYRIQMLRWWATTDEYKKLK